MGAVWGGIDADTAGVDHKCNRSFHGYWLSQSSSQPHSQFPQQGNLASINSIIHKLIEPGYKISMSRVSTLNDFKKKYLCCCNYKKGMTFYILNYCYRDSSV